MPELADVEVYRRYVEATALHRPIVAVEALDELLMGDAPAELVRRTLVGAGFEETARHGKYLFVRLDGRGWLLLHFGMTGDVATFEGDVPPYARLLLAFRDFGRFALVDVRRLGTIDLAENPESFVERKSLGPDALSASRDEFVGALAGRRGGLKAALMNQHVVAGIGNLYADEVCFRARLDPRVPLRELSERDLRAINRSTRQVLRTAIERKIDRSGLPSSWLLAAREDEDPRCPRDRTALQRTKIAGRTTYFRPRCQGRGTAPPA
jgi:formamidopyrimidine-DNA glycosylase